MYDFDICKICPKLLPYIIICIVAIVLAFSVTTHRKEWWNNNAGFCDCKWIFPLCTLLIVGALLTILYVWIWYKSTCVCRTNFINLVFGLAFGLFFCGFIMLFLYKDRKSAMGLIIASLIVMLYQAFFVASHIGLGLGVLMLVIVLFVMHFLLQIWYIKV